MLYANVAVNTPVAATFDYHIPPEMEPFLQPGHLVQVNFRTAMDHAIVLSIHDQPEVERTKPVLARLDPRPVVTEGQIALARWMSEVYRAPIGLCVWMWLPPGLTGHRDLIVSLREKYAPELIVDPVEEEVVALLKRRGTLRGHQLNLALPGKNWRAAVEGLEKYEVVTTESVLSAPRVRPRLIRTAALAIHPNEIAAAVRSLERPSRTADLLETVAVAPGIDVKEALKASGASKSHISRVIDSGWIEQDDDETLHLLISPDDVPPILSDLRKLDKPTRILNILARAGDAVDVSWIYAQADASLPDLKRLEEAELILLGEEQRWRDSLAERTFVAAAPPMLTPAQGAAWERVSKAITQAAEREQAKARASEQAELYEALDQLAQQKRTEPTPAENKLWETIRNQRFDGFQFRRQQPIERFVVDFYCREARLVIEVDGKTGQYSAADEMVRQDYLESLGLRVLRFSDYEIADDLPDVIKQIADAASEQAELGDDLPPLPVETFARKRFTPPQSTPPPTPPRIQGGEKANAEGIENYREWSVPKEIYEAMKQLARQQRTEPTPAENALWDVLRGKQLEGFKFRRQHPIEKFIVDFYSNALQLVIEVDGEIHQYTQAEDAIRQAFLESLGLRVLRFTNDEVLNDMRTVLQKIAAPAKEQTQVLADSSPLPEVGVGKAELRSAGVGSSGATFLLHGVTGSGKTELYLRAIERTLALGRTALLLVPEIALTPQTVRRVAARFPGQTAVVHSALGEGERYDTWRRARDGLVRVVVGARSALFTPLPDVGLIVLDEEHDASYKQSPPILPPYYHARDLAEQMMRQNDGIVILGSATPDVETTYRVGRGEIEKLELPRRIMGHRAHIFEQAERAGVMPRYRPSPGAETASADAVMIDLPPVQIVDMRTELKGGNTSIFSRALQRNLEDVLNREEQAILFLNRRGQSTFVFCRDCGYVARCPRCDMPLTHHRTGSALRCHHCGFQQPEPTVCPQCGSKRIKFFGAGTQQVEQTLNEMFPQARVVRWDSDTANNAEAHEAILQRFIDRRADVMVGTQMVAKGLDLPLVTLVGVVSADIGIALPDFRAGERTFQVLTQVAGRAGRGLLGGRVILQTYQPDHYAIATAARHDYAAFYDREIAYRREIGYPPFRRLVRILFRFPNETKAQQEAERAAGLLRRRLEQLNMTGTELIGPAPCFFTRENNVFRWQVLLRGPDPTPALEGIAIPKGWYVDVDPAEVM